MKLRIALMMGLLTGASFVGCGGPPPDEKIEVASTAIVESVRNTLKDFEKTGKTGSAITSLESDINGIKTSDPAKGELLAKALVELQQLGEGDKVKAKAKEMLQILN